MTAEELREVAESRCHKPPYRDRRSTWLDGFRYALKALGAHSKDDWHAVVVGELDDLDAVAEAAERL